MFELFKIGFLSVTAIDAFDIVLVTLLFYGLYKSLKNTMTVQILFGFLILIGLKFITETINLKAINWILNTIVDIWLIAFIILFQPELRKLLTKISRTSLFQIFSKNKISGALIEVFEAVQELSQNYTGALIVLPRSQDVQMTIDTGVILQAAVSTELLISIFSNKSPLHDGAVVIENQTIMAARCVLPLSSITQHNKRNLGTRHKAGLGLSEVSDALVIIVSEETGWVSLAEEGRLTSYTKANFVDFEADLTRRLYSGKK